MCFFSPFGTFMRSWGIASSIAKYKRENCNLSDLCVSLWEKLHSNDKIKLAIALYLWSRNYMRLMLWICCLAMCIIKEIYSKATRRPIRWCKACASHGACSCVTVTVVITQQKGAYTPFWNQVELLEKALAIISEDSQWGNIKCASMNFLHTNYHNGVPWPAIRNSLIL